MSLPRKRTGIAGRWASFGHAWRGLQTLLATQANARIHAVATLLVVAAGLWCGLPPIEWCALVAAIALVWLAEGLNTALELLSDRVSPEDDPLIGKAKDVAAGAVLVAAIGAALIGALIFLPRLAVLVRG